MTRREDIARLIDPSSWRVFDASLASVKRIPNAGYDPDNFKDRKSLELADQILRLTSEEPITAWLIEWPATKHDPVRYWHASEPRMMDHHDATWFVRKQDAEAVLKRDGLRGGAHAVEHIFGLKP